MVGPPNTCDDSSRPRKAAWRSAIERQDAEIARLRDIINVTHQNFGKAEDEIERLRADNERLRTALEIIANIKPCIDNLMGDKDIARAALAGGQGTS